MSSAMETGEKLKIMTWEEMANLPAEAEDFVELGLRIRNGHATDFDRMMFIEELDRRKFRGEQRRQILAAVGLASWELKQE